MAGILKVQASVDVAGPLADGTADRALDDWAKATAAELARQGADMLRMWPMDKTGRAHGNFQSSLRVIQSGPVARIPGPMISGFTWSPWLEGVSKRNLTTRFKGYRLFRKTAQELRRRAPDVGEQQLRRILPRLGG